MNFSHFLSLFLFFSINITSTVYQKRWRDSKGRRIPCTYFRQWDTLFHSRHVRAPANIFNLSSTSGGGGGRKKISAQCANRGRISNAALKPRIYAASVAGTREGESRSRARLRLSEARKLQLDAAIKSPPRRRSYTAIIARPRWGHVLAIKKKKKKKKEITLTSPGPNFISLSLVRAIMPSIVCTIHARVHEK